MQLPERRDHEVVHTSQLGTVECFIPESVSRQVHTACISRFKGIKYSKKFCKNLSNRHREFSHCRKMMKLRPVLTYWRTEPVKTLFPPRVSTSGVLVAVNLWPNHNTRYCGRGTAVGSPKDVCEIVRRKVTDSSGNTIVIGQSTGHFN